MRFCHCLTSFRQRKEIQWEESNGMYFLTHFPISLFGAAFLFQTVHLFSYPDCFEMSTYIAFVAGMISLIPTT
jgi:hypothetical protein